MVRYESYLGKVLAGRYTLVSIIGTGECSAVFGAFDRVTEKTVALKMLSPERLEDEEAMRRFNAEIHTLSLFHHPNIVRILDVPADGENKFFVMEYIEGITLKKHIQNRGPLDIDEILFLSRQILSALDEVHRKGIVHSDIKPQNIVIVGSGDIKLMDFGISKTLLGQSTEITDVAVGTVQYVSPEQAEGKPLDHLSDIYSFGVTLYEMATGVLPFADENPGRIAAMHVSTAPIPPSMICTNVSPELERVILRAMEKLPEARYPSASAMLDALENIKTPEIPHRTVGISYWHDRSREFLKHLHLPSVLAGILCALLLSVVAGLSILTTCLHAEEQNHFYVRVPDLTGKSITKPLGYDKDVYTLKIEYVTDTSNGGQILSQSPTAGKVVKRGNAPCVITVKVALLPLPAQMPSLAFLPADEALDLLGGYACRIEKQYEKHNYLPNGYVIRTEPQAGEKTGGTVTLVISQK